MEFRKVATASALVAISASAAAAATTPYDLIRPTWPLSWDSAAFDNFDTTGSKILGNLPTEIIPPNFKAGELMADTVDQAYLDAINQHISSIRVNQAGYLKSDKERQFYYVGDAKSFEVVDAKGKSLSTKVTGKFVATSTELSSDWTIAAGIDAARTSVTRYSINFSGPSNKLMIGNIPQNVPTETRLRIKVGDELSSTFIVSEDVYTMVKDAAIKFFGIQRSGNSESWFHGPSHVKDGSGPVKNVTSSGQTATLSGLKAGDLQGGWYDCGDHLKESQTQAYAFMALAVMSATNPDKDVDHYAYNQGEFVKTDGVPDMLREAKHGADFFLRAYRAAKGVIDDMPVSVGDFGSDHSWWGRPEVQDQITSKDRGGAAERTVRLGELGANVSSEIATGLAILSKDYFEHNSKFADSCLKVAEEMYDFAKNLALGNTTYGNKKSFANNTVAAGWGTPAYMGNNDFYDDIALASVALLYASGKEEYLDDALRSTDILKVNAERTGAGFFEGGWFAAGEGGMFKNSKNTSWANSHSFALYALYKLILANSKVAKSFGLTEDERLAAIEDCIADMTANLGDVSSDGSAKIDLIEGGVAWKRASVTYDPTWYTMSTDSKWIFNNYQSGNIFEVLAYADVAADIEKQGIKLPNLEATNWKSSEMFQLGINQLNYMLGVNPWDVSFVYGVGDKNDNHPHHRASNPEGKNSKAFEYKYVRPVGGLIGGPDPIAPCSWDIDGSLSWEDYHISETCLSGATNFISALTIASNGGNGYYKKECDNCGKSNPNPFAADSFNIKSYLYKFADLDYINLQLFNNNTTDLDSVTIHLYFNGTEDEVAATSPVDKTPGTCNTIFDEDMCVRYDDAGFIRSCSDEKDLRSSLRYSHPVKLEDTYNKKDKTYTWELSFFLGDIPKGTVLQIDLSTSSGISQDGATCETLRKPAKVDVSKGWSFAAHEAEKGKPAFDGVPSWDSDQGDIQDPPRAPYIVAERNGKRLWGFAPGDTVEVPKDTTKADSKKDGKKESIDFANLHSLQIGSLQVNGASLLAQAPAQGTKTIKVFDLLGNVVMSSSFEGATAMVNLANASKRGTLIARLMMNNKILATKAIRVK